MKPDNLYVIEWSHSQQCFHVELLSEAVECNMRAFRANRFHDYIPVAMYGCKDDVTAACSRFQTLRNWRRDLQRAIYNEIEKMTGIADDTA